MIGRQDEVQLLNRVSQHPLTLVTGLPGVGKTTVLHAWSAQQRDVIWVSARGCQTTEDILMRLAMVLSVDTQVDAHESIEAALGAMPDAVLIVEHGDEVLSVLCALLEYWQQQQLSVRVIIEASAVPMGIPGARVRIEGLSQSDGVTLLKKWHVDEADASHHVLTRLVDVLDGHPTALMWIAHRRHAIELSSLLETLTSPGVAFSESSVWGASGPLGMALLWCWQSLSEQTQRLCLSLTVFDAAHPFKYLMLWLSEISSPWTADTLLSALQEAIDASFVIVDDVDGQKTFRLSRVMARFLEDNIKPRHVQALCEPGLGDSNDLNKPGDQTPEWEAVQQALFLWLDGHCQQTLDTPHGTPDMTASWTSPLVDEVWSMWRTLRAQPNAPYTNVRRWVARQLEQRGSFSTWFGDVHAAGDQAWSLGEYEQSIRQHISRGHVVSAQRDVEAALSHFGSDHLVAIKLYGVLARIHRDAQRFDAAAEAFERVAHHASMANDLPRVWRNAWRQIQMLLQTASPERAKMPLERLLDAYSRHPHMHGVLPRLNVLLEATSLSLGGPEQTTEALLDELLLLQNTQTPVAIRDRILVTRGDFHALRGQWDDALDAYTQALALWPKQTPVTTTLRCVDVLGLLHRFQDAEALLRALSTDDVEVLWRRGILSFAQQRDDEALLSWQRVQSRLAARLVEERWVSQALIALVQWYQTRHVTAPASTHDVDMFFERLNPTAFVHDEHKQFVLRLCLAVAHEAPLPDLSAWSTPGQSLFLWLAHILAMSLNSRRKILAPQHGDAHLAQSSHAILVYRQAEACMLPDGAWIMLEHKPLFQRAIFALVTHQRDQPGEVFDVGALFEMVWPDEPYTQENAALNRIRVMISRLRTMGFKSWILTATGGYRFAEDVKVVMLDDR